MSETYKCVDGVERTKQELFERMPLLRWENWEYRLNQEGDAYEWVDVT